MIEIILSSSKLILKTSTLSLVIKLYPLLSLSQIKVLPLTVAIALSEIITNNKNEKFSKIIKVNDDQSKETLDFLNKSLSYLIFLPEMERLFQTSPSYRRNFIDRLIFSSKNDYNKLINKYRKLILEILFI